MTASAPMRTAHIEVELVSEVASVRPGEPFWVALRLSPDEHWHTFWRNPGDTGLPTRLDWRLPEGTQAGPIVWPYPQRIPVQHLVNYGYEREILLLTEIRPPLDWNGEFFSLAAKASWLVCQESCIPGDAELSLVLPVSDTAPKINPRWNAVFTKTRKQIPEQRTDWNARFNADDGRISLRIETDEPVFAHASKVVFFPVDQDIFSNAAPEKLEWNNNELLLIQPPSLFLETPPERMAGLLVVTRADGEQAYSFSAHHDPAMETIAPPASVTGSAASGIATALAMAALGGLLLNLMPCVFPILSLKAISLAKSAGVSTTARRLHGLAYALGVMLSFAAVAGLLLLLRAGGQSIGWGFQLQTPWFVALLAYLLFAMGLGLSGAVDIGGRFTGVGDALTRKPGYIGSFFTGVLATVVASPCTAPFMATAIGFAVIQPPITALLVFIALGFGMAFPFLMFALMPQLTRWLPKPGPWMELFKQFMAFPLYLSAVWLLWVLGNQAGANAMAATLAGMVLLAFALWGYQAAREGRLRKTGAVLALASAVSAFAILWLPFFAAAPTATANAASQLWEPYKEDRLAELRTQAKPVFVNLTADWCITCLVNEQIALSSDAFQRKLIDNNITYLKGDWTNRDPEITALLARFGRNGVPLYVFYPGDPDAEPILLPQLLTPKLVLDILERS